MKDEQNLEKMIAVVQKILTYVGGYDYETFCDNEMLVEACDFNLAQLGELAHKMSDVFVESHADLPWNEMYGLRNRLIHDYQGVNLRLVWEIVSDDLSVLKVKLEGAV